MHCIKFKNKLNRFLYIRRVKSAKAYYCSCCQKTCDEKSKLSKNKNKLVISRKECRRLEVEQQLEVDAAQEAMTSLALPESTRFPTSAE